MKTWTRRALLAAGILASACPPLGAQIVNDGALFNTALVTGPGSGWLGDDSLYVGHDGSFNRLFVRNGGRVTGGLAALGANQGANGNLALIADAGSVWSNRLWLDVGQHLRDECRC